jgi:hypothetical protein
VEQPIDLVVFGGDVCVEMGPFQTVARALKSRSPDQLYLTFDAATGRQIDLNLGDPQPPMARTGRGRPRLGVVGREVSLLPRHWDWLEDQPNGASAAIRRLVDQARGHDPETAKIRGAQEAAHRFMTAMAGNRPGYEEALRALYARDRKKFEAEIRHWPEDVGIQTLRFAEGAWRD